MKHAAIILASLLLLTGCSSSDDTPEPAETIAATQDDTTPEDTAAGDQLEQAILEQKDVASITDLCDPSINSWDCAFESFDGTTQDRAVLNVTDIGADDTSAWAQAVGEDFLASTVIAAPDLTAVTVVVDGHETATATR